LKKCPKFKKGDKVGKECREEAVKLFCKKQMKKGKGVATCMKKTWKCNKKDKKCLKALKKA